MSDSFDKYFLSMSNLYFGNPLFKAKLFEYFNFDIEKTFNANKEDLKGVFEFYEGEITIPRDFLKKRDEISPDKIYEDFLSKAEKFNIKYITYEDEKYPQMNAKEALHGIISGLKGSDIVIVSGLAEGIDARSHKSALENGLKTIGVIGSGFEFTYPSSNKKLYLEIENGGGLIFSEYPYETPPMAYQFPLRNRIVVGMSYGTVVAEARIKSGAMISARLTLDFNRELMCMPGLISNPNTEGIYHLLKNGASMVTNADDILEALGWELETVGREELYLEGIEKEIYGAVAIEAQNIEVLSQKLNIKTGDLMANLTSMELKGLIKQAGGNYFISG